jgi:hypothetical protein
MAFALLQAADRKDHGPIMPAQCCPRLRGAVGWTKSLRIHARVNYRDPIGRNPPDRFEDPPRIVAVRNEVSCIPKNAPCHPAVLAA